MSGCVGLINLTVTLLIFFRLPDDDNGRGRGNGDGADIDENSDADTNVNDNAFIDNSLFEMVCSFSFNS